MDGEDDIAGGEGACSRAGGDEDLRGLLLEAQALHAECLWFMKREAILDVRNAASVAKALRKGGGAAWRLAARIDAVLRGRRGPEGAGR